MHYSVIMAANVLGMGYDNAVKVKVDSMGRMDAEDLEKQVRKSK